MKPGEIIHLDIKKLDRFNSVGHRITGRRTGHCSSHAAGWEYAHVAIDDHSRVARACRQLGLELIKTKPYTPQTNGKAERFIQTALREWDYATAFEHAEQRRQAVLPWLHRYNWHGPHASLAKKAPISRLGLTGNNLLRLHS